MRHHRERQLHQLVIGLLTDPVGSEEGVLFGHGILDICGGVIPRETMRSGFVQMRIACGPAHRKSGPDRHR
jgi:hypothetical protein